MARSGGNCVPRGIGSAVAAALLLSGVWLGIVGGPQGATAILHHHPVAHEVGLPISRALALNAPGLRHRAAEPVAVIPAPSSRVLVDVLQPQPSAGPRSTQPHPLGPGHDWPWGIGLLVLGGVAAAAHRRAARAVAVRCRWAMLATYSSVEIPGRIPWSRVLNDPQPDPMEQDVMGEASPEEWARLEQFGEWYKKQLPGPGDKNQLGRYYGKEFAARVWQSQKYMRTSPYVWQSASHLALLLGKEPAIAAISRNSDLLRLKPEVAREGLQVGGCGEQRRGGGGCAWGNGVAHHPPVGEAEGVRPMGRVAGFAATLQAASGRGLGSPAPTQLNSTRRCSQSTDSIK